jgi:hypothetical protein
MHNVWHDYCTVCCMATANTQKVAISNIRKRVGCLIEPSPPTASCKMGGNEPGGLRTANCSHKRLKKLQPLMGLMRQVGFICEPAFLKILRAKTFKRALAAAQLLSILTCPDATSIIGSWQQKIGGNLDHTIHAKILGVVCCRQVSSWQRQVGRTNNSPFQCWISRRSCCS